MTTTKTGPIEVWLTQSNMIVNCRVVHEDESTSELEIDSLSMRGAQREITGWFISQGYKPDGRWSMEYQDQDEPIETMRRFRAPTGPDEGGSRGQSTAAV